MNYPPKDRLSSLGALLATLGLRWAGAEAVSAGKLRCRSGAAGRCTADAGRVACNLERRAASGHDVSGHPVAVVDRSARRGPSILHLYRFTLDTGESAVVVGDASGRVWPLGRVFETEATIPTILADWLTIWTQTAGSEPAQLVADATLEPGCRHWRRRRRCSWRKRTALPTPKRSALTSRDGKRCKPPYPP